MHLNVPIQKRFVSPQFLSDKEWKTPQKDKHEGEGVRQLLPWQICLLIGMRSATQLWAS